jgi:hypothetical protein
MLLGCQQIVKRLFSAEANAGRRIQHGGFHHLVCVQPSWDPGKGLAGSFVHNRSAGDHPAKNWSAAGL